MYTLLHSIEPNADKIEKKNALLRKQNKIREKKFKQTKPYEDKLSCNHR